MLKTTPSSIAPNCIATIMLIGMQLTKQDIWSDRIALLKTGMLSNSSHCSFPLMLASLAFLKEENMHEPVVSSILFFFLEPTNSFSLPSYLFFAKPTATISFESLSLAHTHEQAPLHQFILNPQSLPFSF